MIASIFYIEHILVEASCLLSKQKKIALVQFHWQGHGSSGAFGRFAAVHDNVLLPAKELPGRIGLQAVPEGESEAR